MNKLARVGRANKCPICDHDTWCLYNEEVAICMRVQSSKLYTFTSGETGYIHRLKDTVSKPVHIKKGPVVPSINAPAVYQGIKRHSNDAAVADVAFRLGLPIASLQLIGAAWSDTYHAAAFPMVDGNGIVVGIRLRSNDGSKFAVKGSRQGIFVPLAPSCSRVYIVEGPTDTAAMIAMGAYAIGRPSCLGGTNEIVTLIKRLRIERAVIVADNDADKEIGGRRYNPGYDGAKSLGKSLPIPNCIIALPTKDAREYYRMGGDLRSLDSIAESQLWTIEASG